MIQHPVALGLMLCEQVIVQETTRNLTPVNCFSKREVAQFPSEAVPFVLFVVLTDGMGTMNMEIVIQRLENLDVIYRRAVPCQFSDPLQEVRGIFRINTCSFPAPGYYQISLWAEKELVAQRRFEIN
jgi:hypothetical protein